jgi:hypothetical protein
MAYLSPRIVAPVNRAFIPWLLSLRAKSDIMLCRLCIVLLLLHSAWRSKGSVSWEKEKRTTAHARMVWLPRSRPWV